MCQDFCCKPLNRFDLDLFQVRLSSLRKMDEIQDGLFLVEAMAIVRFIAPENALGFQKHESVWVVFDSVNGGGFVFSKQYLPDIEDEERRNHVFGLIKKNIAEILRRTEYTHFSPVGGV